MLIMQLSWERSLGSEAGSLPGRPLTERPMDYLMRDQAPLTPDQWARLDQIVAETGRQMLVGRRFIPVTGPFGPGVQALPNDEFEGHEMGGISRTGEAPEPGGMVHAIRRTYLPLPILYKDFRLNWRDIESSRQQGVALDLAAVAIAAAAVARTEDDLIFNGRQDLGYQGLLTDPDRQRMPVSDWTEGGSAFGDVVNATRRLVEDGFYGPYAVAVSPREYALLHRVLDNTGVLEIEQIQKLAHAGVYQTSVLPAGTAVVVSAGEQNMDLAVAEDMTTAFLTAEQMNYDFRVFEVVALRIKRPGAICKIGGP